MDNSTAVTGGVSPVVYGTLILVYLLSGFQITTHTLGREVPVLAQPLNRTQFCFPEKDVPVETEGWIFGACAR